MTPLNFRSLDLNLLRVFDEVMAERSLTRAAHKLSITQPAVSNAMRRLRDVVGDELVVRSGQGVEPTPIGLALWTPVREALTQLQESLAPGRFDPAAAESTFVLAMADATAATLVPALVGIIVCFCYARHLDAFSFGAESAASLGIPVKRTRGVLITAVTGMTAIMVSIVGAIGFVGLVIPHAARLLVGNQHHRLLPVSALIGAIFLIVADVISRTLLPGQVLPIGVITALVGAPAFSIILIRGNPSK